MSTTDPRQLHLAVNVQGLGLSPRSWLNAGDNALGALDPAHFTHIAKTAERGHLDAFFLADSLAPPFPPEFGIVWGLDPLLLLASLANVTEHIGLVASVSTTFNEPYNVARAVASLDHLSRGRASWNVVTSYDPAAALKYGLAQLPEREARYRRAEEFVDVVRRLWDTWPGDAIVLDRERGVYAESDRIAPLDHHGEFFDVSGSLQLPGGVNGHPPLFQAGGSPAGLDLAARFASGVFSAQHTIRGARRAYDDLKGRLAAHGRTEDELKVLPGVMLTIGDTDEAAQRRVRETNEQLGENETTAGFLARLGLDLPVGDYDRPVPPEVREIFERGFHNRGFDQATLDLLDEQPDITPRALAAAGGNVHRSLVGGPERIANDLQAWFEAGAADGFIVMFDHVPAGLEAFVDHVVPLLVERGIFRSEYRGSTLREHLGLGAGQVALS